MRIAILGSHGVPTVEYFAEALTDAGFDITIVRNTKCESQKDIDIWAHRTKGQLPALRYVGQEIVIDRISSSDGADILRSFDLALNGGILEILKGDVLYAPKHGVLNIHPGILPKYRGCCAVEWAIYNGDPIGVTAHLMDEGIDTGPIVLAKTLDRSEFRNYEDIRVAVYRLSFEAAAEAAMEFRAGTAKPAPQTEGTYWSPIDDQKLAAVLDRLVG